MAGYDVIAVGFVKPAFKTSKSKVAIQSSKIATFTRKNTRIREYVSDHLHVSH